jgi:hypothetical protein
MIFDFYISFYFNELLRDTVKPINFKDEPFYATINGEQVFHKLQNGAVTCLHRRNYRDSFADTIHQKMWLFGYAYTTKSYSESINQHPFKLTAGQIFRIMENHPNDYFKYLKGSFVLVLVNENQKRVTVVTDRLNVLPLYYAYNGNRLIISSNTSMMLKAEWVNKEFDPLALAMQNLFDYMLGEYFYFKGIRRCENATIYEFTASGLKKKIYWDVSDLYHERLLPKKLSLDLLSEKLKENVDLYASDCEKLLLSLTGGFDGRTILSLLDLPNDDFLCYSYGMPESKQIRVPRIIADKTGIQYQPILLGQDFIDSYHDNTIKASYFSNGTAPVGFSNIPYAYEKLSSFSDTIMTGLFGSEILRPLHNNGIQINDQSFGIFSEDDYEKGVLKAIQRTSDVSLCGRDLLSDCRDELVTFIRKRYFDKYREYDKTTRFFFFIIQEGIRKYFSQEISIERVYVTTRFPYFDTDLVDLIYRTPWAGMYNGFLGESKFKRRKGQLLYAHVIRKYKPELGRIVLDRGYAPDDLLLPFPLNFLKIAAGVHHAKKYMKNAGGNDTFQTETWARECIKKIVGSKSSFSGHLFGDRLSAFKLSKDSSVTSLTYRHMVSLKAFFDMVIQ